MKGLNGLIRGKDKIISVTGASGPLNARRYRLT